MKIELYRNKYNPCEECSHGPDARDKNTHMCEICEFRKLTIRRAEQLNEPLTLSEVKEHLSKRHPHEIEPLYVMFDPPMPVNHAPRWRDAYNLLAMVEAAADDYGKTWIAYRQRPESEDDEPVDLEAIV